MSGPWPVETVGFEAAEGLAELHARAFAAPWSLGDLRALMGGYGAVALAAGEAERRLGFILMRCVAGEAEILTLAVSPAARRRGVGVALVDAAASTAFALSADRLWLEVATDNDAAVALYRKAGFAVTGRRPGYYTRQKDGPVDALVMLRVLNTAAA